MVDTPRQYALLRGAIMKPHIEIRTDKPEELLKVLEQIQQDCKGPAWPKVQAFFEGAQIRLVDTGHQGYANYESFCIGIMIDSDRELLGLWLAQAKECLNKPDPERNQQFGNEGAAELDLADALKEYFDDNSPEIDAPWNSLCNAALGNVDWLDLARHYLGKVKEGVSV